MNKFYRNFRVGLGITCGVVLPIGSGALASTSISIKLDPTTPGRVISREFNGLSIEMSDVCSAVPDTSGKNNGMTITNWSTGCSSDKSGPGANEGLLGVGEKNSLTSHSAQLFQGNFNGLIKRLGIKNIRVGGTSADSLSQRAYPPLQTAKNVIDFAKAVGLTELEWNLPALGASIKTYAAYAVDLLEYKESVFPDLKLIFEIGNENDLVGSSYTAWLQSFKLYVSEMYAATPSRYQKKLFFAGPSTAKTPWYAQTNSDPYFTTDGISENKLTGIRSRIGYISAHNYPLGGGYTSPCLGPQSAGDGTTCLSLVQKLLSSSGNTVGSVLGSSSYEAKLPGRLMETNSMFNGGIEGAGDSYAAALWSLDYAATLAQNTELSGLNLHLGATNGGYAPISPPYTTGSGSDAVPTLKAVGYGMLAFNEFSQGGKIIEPTIENGSSRVTAYGSLQSNGKIRMLIINRNWTDNGNDDVIATISVPKNYAVARSMSLMQSAADPTALHGITFGGSSVASDGAWAGAWTAPKSSNGNGIFTVTVPAVQAMLIEFSQLHDK